MTRLRNFVEFFQGEVNEKNERNRGTLVEKSQGACLVTRGASICLYSVRPASQGEDLFLNVSAFLDGKGQDTKAYHHRYARVGLQESCPQNNFRRVIAAPIAAGSFCNHTINYCTTESCHIPLELLLGFLNSKLADWYFRIGSTNAHVSHYQLYNFPFPEFAKEPADPRIANEAQRALNSREFDVVFSKLNPALRTPPFSQAIRTVIVDSVQRIVAIEGERGEISRAARSALDPSAQPYQDLIDRLIFAMAGLTLEESSGLEERLSVML